MPMFLTCNKNKNTQVIARLLILLYWNCNCEIHLKKMFNYKHMDLPYEISLHYSDITVIAYLENDKNEKLTFKRRNRTKHKYVYYWYDENEMQIYELSIINTDLKHTVSHWTCIKGLSYTKCFDQQSSHTTILFKCWPCVSGTMVNIGMNWSCQSAIVISITSSS